MLNLLDSDGRNLEYFCASKLARELLEGVEDRHFHRFEPRQVRVTITIKLSARSSRCRVQAQGGQHASLARERPPAVHDLVVIDQRHIARFPREIKDEFVGNLDR